MVKILNIFALSVFMLLSGTSFAADENEVYAGIKWRIGEKSPVLFLGYRDADVDSSNDVDGYDFSISLNLLQKKFDKIVVKGFSGRKNIQGEIGVGYSLLEKTPLFRIGAQGDYVTLNIDYLLKLKKIALEMGINSVGEYKLPTVAAPMAMPMSLPNEQ